MAVTVGNIHIGRGDLYVGVTPPVTPPVALTGGVPGSGTSIGATLEGANMIYRPTTVDVYTQQSPVLALSVTNTEDLRLEFTIGELTFANLKQFLQGGAGAGPSFVTVGGIVVPAATGLLLVAPRRDGSYIEAMIYSAFFPEDRTIPFAREGVSMVKVVARALGVFTRAVGDQLGFLQPSVTSS